MNDNSSGDEAGAERESTSRFVQVFGRYRQAIARAIARIVVPNDVEDVLQETYLRILQAEKLQTIRHPGAFMLTTARNVALNMAMRADALNHVDSSRPDPQDESTLPPEAWLDGHNTAEHQVQIQEEFHLLCRALRELPPQCRKAFVLKRVYGLSQREVASELGITESTVEKHLAKALVACGDYMSARGYPQQSARAVRNRKGQGGA